MPLNSSSDTKSFETIELLPIQEMLTDISEPTSILETPEIKMPSVETNVSQTPINTEAVLGVPSGEVPKPSNPWSRHLHDLDAKPTDINDNNIDNTYADNTYIDNTYIPDVTSLPSDSGTGSTPNPPDYSDNYYTSSNNINNDISNNTSYSINNNTSYSTDNTNQELPRPSVKLSFSDYFRAGMDAENEQQEARKKKLMASWFAIITLVILVIVTHTIKNLYSRISRNDEQKRITIENYPDGETREYTDFEGLLTSANPDYQIFFLENIKYANQPCAINPELIIHVGEKQRTLYFRIMPQEDNIVPRITVTAYDINGNQIAENIQSLYGVGAYDIGILPITLNIPADATGVGYTVKCNGGTMATPDTQRVIHDIRAEDDHIYVSVYGQSNLDRNVFVILYKDGELVDILSARPGGYYTGQYREAETDFDVSQIDFDNFEVYI